MCLAQQNSDGEESHDGLTDEKSTQIAADAVDGEGKQHKEDADAEAIRFSTKVMPG